MLLAIPERKEPLCAEKTAQNFILATGLDSIRKGILSQSKVSPSFWLEVARWYTFPGPRLVVITRNLRICFPHKQIQIQGDYDNEQNLLCIRSKW